MRPAIKTALLLSSIWIAIKFIFMAIDFSQDDIIVPGLINNLLLLISISVGLYLEKKKEGFGVGTALSDIKNAMKAGVPYVFIVSLFMYFYYDAIHPEFIENKRIERLDRIYTQMERDSYVDSLKLQNPQLKVKTNEEIARIIKTDEESNLSARSIFFISLLGLIVLALTYAILITLIYQKILFKDYYDSR